MLITPYRDPRPICPKCRMAGTTCYCALVRPFSAEPLVVVLVHPKETKKRIGTARIVKLCVENSILISGTGPEFDQDPKLLSLLSDPTLDPMILYPGPDARQIDQMSPAEIAALSPKNRRPAVFLIDGTWSMAKKMIRTSQRLSQLRKIAFTPQERSRYLIRKQPKDICLSTVEAVHTVLALLSPEQRALHDNLLAVFDRMVKTQVELELERAQADLCSTPPYGN